MKRSTVYYLVSILMFVSLLGAQVVLAESDFSTPDEEADQNLDPHANACFEGGTLAGKCNSEEMWNAGWFLIRLEQGLIDLDDFPAEYAWVLPDHGPEDDAHEQDDTHESEGVPQEEVCLEPTPAEPEAHEG